VTTSTTGVAGSGKLITATFSLAMNPATINSASPGTLSTFTLKDMTTANGTIVPGTVAMNTANTIATFTTSAALLANTSYTAIITTAATSVTGTPIACAYAWSFKTAGIAIGLAPINMGLAAPFGIAATAGITDTSLSTTVNGNVVLDPTHTCDGVTVDGAGGIGLCNPPTHLAPTINGTVISSLYNPGGNLATIKADLLAAFLSITPPAGPPAAGSLGGGTTLAAPTTLGDLAGNPYVQGDNYFVPGVYTDTDSSILITGDLTLDAQNNPDAVFVFQSHSTIGTAAGAAPPGVRTRILLINGAKASNVWWQAATSATLGLYSEFQGNILASASITMGTGATSCGRLLAGAFTAGAFVFDGNVVSVPGQPFAPPATYSTTCQ